MIPRPIIHGDTPRAATGLQTQRRHEVFSEMLRSGLSDEKAGAANRTRTCDPVITNDVLYQLSYCGGPTCCAQAIA